MTKQQQIQNLITARNNGDLSAQAKIDALFFEHRKETQVEREVGTKALSQSNSEIYKI